MKEEILNFVNDKYKGSLRFLKPKMFVGGFGEKKYQKVLDENNNYPLECPTCKPKETSKN